MISYTLPRMRLEANRELLIYDCFTERRSDFVDRSMSVGMTSIAPLALLLGVKGRPRAWLCTIRRGLSALGELLVLALCSPSFE